MPKFLKAATSALRCSRASVNSSAKSSSPKGTKPRFARPGKNLESTNNGMNGAVPNRDLPTVRVTKVSHSMQTRAPRLDHVQASSSGQEHPFPPVLCVHSGTGFVTHHATAITNSIGDFSHSRFEFQEHVFETIADRAFTDRHVKYIVHHSTQALVADRMLKSECGQQRLNAHSVWTSWFKPNRCNRQCSRRAMLAGAFELRDPSDDWFDLWEFDLLVHRMVRSMASSRNTPHEPQASGRKMICASGFGSSGRPPPERPMLFWRGSIRASFVAFGF